MHGMCSREEYLVVINMKLGTENTFPESNMVRECEITEYIDLYLHVTCIHIGNFVFVWIEWYSKITLSFGLLITVLKIMCNIICFMQLHSQRWYEQPFCSGNVKKAIVLSVLHMVIIMLI